MTRRHPGDSPRLVSQKLNKADAETVGLSHIVLAEVAVELSRRGLAPLPTKVSQIGAVAQRWANVADPHVLQSLSDRGGLEEGAAMRADRAVIGFGVARRAPSYKAVSPTAILMMPVEVSLGSLRRGEDGGEE